MIQVIFTYLKLSLQSFFRKEKFWIRIGLFALFSVFAFYNAFALGMLLKSGHSDKDQIIQITMFVIGILMIISIWFPSLSRKTAVIPEIFPFSGWQRAFIHWKLSFFGNGFIPFLIFLFFLFFFGEVTSLLTIATALAICLSFFAIKLFILTALQSRLKSKVPLLISILLIFAWVTIQFLKAKDFIPNYLSLLDWILPLCSYLFVESSVKSTKQIHKHSGGAIGNWQSFQLFWRHPIARNSLLIGFGLKLVASAIYLYEGEGLHAIMFILLTPIVSFNYVLNNCWGYYKNLWYSNQLKSGTFSDVVKQYWTITQFPFLIDVLLSIVVLFMIDEKFVANMLTVLSSSIFILAAGLLWSNYFPKKIGSVMKMNGNTHQLASLFNVFAVLPLLAMKVHYYFYPIAILYPIAAYIIYSILKKDYVEKRHIIYQKLF